jgi:hypothetical protein
VKHLYINFIHSVFGEAYELLSFVFVVRVCLSYLLLVKLLHFISCDLWLKADFQSSHVAPRSSLRVHAWALTSNHNAKQLILIRCKGASCEDWKSAFTPCTSFVLGLLIFKYHGWMTELKRCYWMIRSLYWNTMCSLTVHRAQNCINANKKI